MDKMNASLESCLESIKEKLDVDPFVVQIPIISSDHFEGVIDLINMKVNLEKVALPEFFRKLLGKMSLVMR